DGERGRTGEGRQHHDHPDDEADQRVTHPEPPRPVDVANGQREVWIFFVELALDLVEDALFVIVKWHFEPVTPLRLRVRSVYGCAGSTNGRICTGSAGRGVVEKTRRTNRPRAETPSDRVDR